jgi:CheY-like chemotaxis protein
MMQAAASSERLRILLVGDDRRSREAVLRYLHWLGHDAVEAVSGLMALHLCEHCPFDVVITDLHMPGLDGLELLRQFLDSHVDFPSACLSGSTPDHTAMVIDSAAFGFLQRPFSLTKLAECLLFALPSEELRP